MERKTYLLKFFIAFSVIVACDVHASISEALKAMKSNDSSLAFKILQPISKADGPDRGEALFLIGQLYLHSENIEGHELKAAKYFKAAADQNHPYAAILLDKLALNRTLAVSSVKQDLTFRASAEKRFNETVTLKPIVTTFHVFIKDPNDSARSLIKILDSYRLNDSISITYHLVLPEDPRSITQNPDRIEKFNPPKNGFSPDIGGVKAKSFGIRSFPSIYYSSKSGKNNQQVTLEQTIEYLERSL